MISYAVADEFVERNLLEADRQKDKYNLRSIYGPYEFEKVKLYIQQGPKPVGIRSDFDSYDEYNFDNSVIIDDTSYFYSYDEAIDGGSLQIHAQYEDTFFLVQIYHIGPDLTDTEINDKINDIFDVIQKSYTKYHETN